MFLFFLGGSLFGSFVTFLIIGKITQNQFADSYSTDVIEQLTIAKRLRENKQKELSENIENRLPGYVLAIHHNKELQSSEYYMEALWHIKSFYETNAIPFPAEIAEIMTNLPPEPPNVCQFTDAAK